MSFSHVETEGLVKLYGPTRALAGVSLRFESGHVTAVEGPNGSGKSTLLRLLALLVRPTRGQIRFGSSVVRAPKPHLRRQIGVLGHEAMLYPDLSGLENLALVARLYDLDPSDLLPALRPRFELGAWAERRVRTLSRGQRQRLSLARALLHQPRLLLLDEPSTGLDAHSTDRLVAAVKQERERGALVVLVSHDRGLTERLADRRFELLRGQVVERQ